ncbi:MAG: ATP-binding cassette domain-containing protein, partial [Oscillospiraceae bacterium]|nr:ATP-binding cassette domain-containing protein [Oscillospiraceae bacterium]
MPEQEQNKTIPHLKWYGIPAILPFIRPHLPLIITIAVTMAISSAGDAILPLFQNYAINHYIGDGVIDTLPLFAGLYLAVLLFQSFNTALGCYVANTAEVRVDRDVRQACFDHIQTLSFSYFNQNSVGYIHSRIVSDPNRIGQIVSWGLMDIVLDAIYILAIFIIMFRLNPWLGLLLLCVIPIMVAVTVYFQRHLTRENRKVRERNSIITGNFNEGITGAKTIKALVVEDRMQRDFEDDTGKMRTAAVRAGWYRAVFQCSIVFCSSLALALVLWRGGLLTRSGLMLLGSLSVFMNYATSVSFYVQDLVGTIANLINTQVNIERVMRLLNTKSDVTDTPEVIERYGDSFQPKRENWEPLEGEIEFRDVTFRYPDGEENVLEHFNLKVPKGTMVAIVGETGAGKSTLVNLVCRFYEPTEGQVLIDGRDARARSQLWLHSHIGYVLQTPHLFSGTVLENLRYGNP